MNNFTIKIENCRRELKQLQNENEKLTSRLHAEKEHCSELESQVRRAHEERLLMAESCGEKEAEIASALVASEPLNTKVITGIYLYTAGKREHLVY